MLFRKTKRILSFYILEQGLKNIFCKGAGSKYFWLCGPEGLMDSSIVA